MKELCVEFPNQDEQYHPWNDATKSLFALDRGDIEHLEDDNVLWREGAAFSLVDAE